MLVEPPVTGNDVSSTAVGDANAEELVFGIWFAVMCTDVALPRPFT